MWGRIIGMMFRAGASWASRSGNPLLRRAATWLGYGYEVFTWIDPFVPRSYRSRWKWRKKKKRRRSSKRRRS